MAKHTNTSKMIDDIIRFGVTTAAIGSVLVLPGIAIALDKPLASLFKRLDKRERQRELKRIVYYMKEQNYLSGDYLHGLQITDKARQRLLRRDGLKIQPQEIWDKKWRIIIYDIPEKHKNSRNQLTHFMRTSGFYQLQKSAWITPFPCRDVIEALTARLHIDQYVTYFESTHLDNEQALLEHARSRYSTTKF